jgi:hypothetical protein
MPMPQNLKKGQILVVRVPPFFDREYFYEVMAAGGKMIRASLYRSPKVKKQWTLEEYGLLIEHGLIRLAGKDDLSRLSESGDTPSAAGEEQYCPGQEQAEDLE